MGNGVTLIIAMCPWIFKGQIVMKAVYVLFYPHQDAEFYKTSLSLDFSSPLIQR